jgi:Protein of unknown function (DUF2905)
MDIRRFLIVVGLALVAVGALWPYLSRIGFGRLPGDIAVEQQNGFFYFPIVTCLLISVALTLLFWLFRK